MSILIAVLEECGVRGRHRDGVAGREAYFEHLKEN